MNLNTFVSRRVRAVGYRPEERKLVVAFHCSGACGYYGVAQVLFDELTSGVPAP